MSCGYDAEYEQTEPGKAEQSILPETMWLLSPKAEPEIVGNWRQRHNGKSKEKLVEPHAAAIKTGDADTMNELVESAPARLQEMRGICRRALISISTCPAATTTGQSTRDGWRSNRRQDDDLKTLLKALLAKLEGNATAITIISLTIIRPVTARTMKRNHDYW